MLELLTTFCAGTVIMGISVYSSVHMILDADGHNADFWCMSIYTYTPIILAVNINQILRAGQVSYF